MLRFAAFVSNDVERKLRQTTVPDNTKSVEFVFGLSGASYLSVHYAI